MIRQIDVSSRRDRTSPIQYIDRSSRRSSIRTLEVGEDIEIDDYKKPVAPPQDEPFSFNFFDDGPAIRTARKAYLSELTKGVTLVSVMIFCLFSIYWGTLWILPAGSVEGWIVVRLKIIIISILQSLTEDRTSTVAPLVHSSHNGLWRRQSHLYIGTSFPQRTFRAEFHKLRMPWWIKRHGLP